MMAIRVMRIKIIRIMSAMIAACGWCQNSQYGNIHIRTRRTYRFWKEREGKAEKANWVVCYLINRNNSVKSVTICNYCKLDELYAFSGEICQIKEFRRLTKLG